MVGAKTVLMNLRRPDCNILEFPLHDQSNSNVPTVVGVACTSKERNSISPLLRPALAKHIMTFDDDWRKASHAVEHEFLTQASLHHCLTDPSNVNLTNGQKELLLWHWKLVLEWLEFKSSWFRIVQRMTMACRI